MSFISSFENIKVVVPDPMIFLFIAASVADVAALSLSIPKGLIMTILTLVMVLKILKIHLLAF